MRRATRSQRAQREHVGVGVAGQGAACPVALLLHQGAGLARHGVGMECASWCTRLVVAPSNRFLANKQPCSCITTCSPLAAPVSTHKFSVDQLPLDQQPVFSISPTRLTIEPKECATFVVSGMAHTSVRMAGPVWCRWGMNVGVCTLSQAPGGWPLALCATPCLALCTAVIV